MTVGAIILIPGTLYAIAAGYIFGTYFNSSIPGYVLSLFFYLTIQGLTGLVVFVISKACFKKTIRKHFIETNNKLKQLDKVLAIYSTKALFLFRLSPIFPTTLLNYVLGGFSSKILYF